MKFILILLCIGSWQLSAKVAAQQVTLQLRNATFEEVAKAIEKQTGLTFLYSSPKVKHLNNLTLDVNGKEVSEVLKQCLQGSNLSYRMVESTIIIMPNKEAGQPQVKEQIYSGTVLDVKKISLPGVTVLLKGTTLGTVTDSEGKFILRLPNQKEVTLIFSCIGMTTQEVVCYPQKPVTIQMQESTQNLDEVVATGYFIRDKQSFTGSATVIKKEELLKVGGNNVLRSLAVFDPSFKIEENLLDGSNPNAKLDIRIRGNSGLGSGELDLLDRSQTRGNPNLPTFILDGYEVSVEKIQDMDINRIESISILKDATATAIYGSRAANGVVVVKSIAPKEGELRVNYNFEATLTWPDLSDYDLLNGKEKLELERLAGLYTNKITAGQQSGLDAEYNKKKMMIAQGVNTDWLVQPLDRTTFGHKHSLYVEGGSRAIRYGLDAKYETLKGVMKESKRDRMSLGASLSYNRNDKLLFRNYLSVDYVRANESPYGSFQQYVEMNPYLAFKDQDGNMLRNLDKWTKYWENNEVVNPLYEATLHNVDQNDYTELMENLDFEWHIIPSLKVKAQMSVHGKFERADRFTSPKSLKYDSNTDGEAILEKGYYSQDHKRSFGYNGNFIASYNANFNNHFINAVLGGNIMEDSFDQTLLSAEGFPNENVDHIALARQYAKERKAPGGGEEKTRLAGMFLSLNYTYMNKYLFDFSYRLDGSSQFGSEKKTAPFWSLGIGWNLHKENFLSQIKQIDLLKIRATTGKVGKASFAPYQAQTTYAYGTSNWYSGVVGATLLGFGNKELKWETTKTYDAGIDLSIFNGLFSVTANYYIKETDNLLTDISTPPSSGVSSYRANMGKVENKGFEIVARAFVWRKNDLSVNVFGNMSRNRNKIKEISNSLRAYNDRLNSMQNNGEHSAKPLLRYQEGASMTSIYAMKSLGIDPASGNELFLNKEGRTTYNWNAGEQMVVGNTEPDLEGYFGTNADYKGWNLYLNFHYRIGGQAYNQTLIDRVENADPRVNVDRRVLEGRWQKPGDVTFYKNIADRTWTRASSRFVQDYNFLSLSSVTLSYDLKKEWAQAIRFENIRLQCTMNDVFRCSTVKQERGINYPFARNIAFSIQTRF